MRGGWSVYVGSWRVVWGVVVWSVEHEVVWSVVVGVENDEQGVLPVTTSNNQNMFTGSHIDCERTFYVSKITIPLKLLLLSLAEEGVPVLTRPELCVCLGEQVHTSAQKTKKKKREDIGYFV
jgi:hypothetical protein